MSYPAEVFGTSRTCSPSSPGDLTLFPNSCAWSTAEFLPASLVREALKFHQQECCFLITKSPKCSPKGSLRFCSVVWNAEQWYPRGNVYLLSARHVFEISCQCNPSPVNCTDRAPALHRAWWHRAVRRATSFSDVFDSPEQVYVYKPQSLSLQVLLGAVNCRTEITYLFAGENCQILEWFSLEGAFWDFLVQPPCASRVS